MTDQPCKIKSNTLYIFSAKKVYFSSLKYFTKSAVSWSYIENGYTIESSEDCVTRS